MSSNRPRARRNARSWMGPFARAQFSARPESESPVSFLRARFAFPPGDDHDLPWRIATLSARTQASTSDRTNSAGDPLNLKPFFLFLVLIRTNFPQKRRVRVEASALDSRIVAAAHACPSSLILVVSYGMTGQIDRLIGVWC